MGLIDIVIAVVAGAVGGWALGYFMKTMTLGTVGDLIAGLVGGVILVWIGIAANFAYWGVAYLGIIVLGLVGGAVLTGIASAVKRATMK